MAATRKKTDEVLASARKELQAQLAVVRDDLSRLASEEHALTQALSSLDGGHASSSTPAAKAEGGTQPARRSQRRTSPGKAGRSGRRRRGARSKSTAERVNELQGLLADGPKSRNDLATALKVSPARVQQLLAELGDSVASQQDPEQRRVKLWTLTSRGNDARAARPNARRTSGTVKATSTRKPTGRRKTAAK